MSESDLELLARYTRDHSGEAFAELVRRHLDLVHSAALRQVRSPQLAEEVAQSTFIKLAGQAAQLAPDTVLAAWLYQVARREAIDVVRREARRQWREQIATEMNAMNAATDDWTHIEPLLDDAMHALDEIDRTAVLLRYFENKPVREVGATLGTSENAAQKRLGRAVEQMREFFAKRGVTVGTSGLVVVVSAHAVQAAPVGLAATIATAAGLAGTTLATTATVTIAKSIVMTAPQKVLIIATLVALVGMGIYQARRVAQTPSNPPLPARQSLAADAMTLATNGAWQSEFMKLKLRGGVVSEERLVIEFGAVASGGQSNGPDAKARLSIVTVPQGSFPAQANSSLGDGSFRNVRLQEKDGVRTMTISSAKLETGDPQKTQREIERYKKLGGYWAITFPYELNNNQLTLKGFPITNAVGWGVTEFTVAQSEITFRLSRENPAAHSPRPGGP